MSEIRSSEVVRGRAERISNLLNKLFEMIYWRYQRTKTTKTNYVEIEEIAKEMRFWIMIECC